MTSEALFKVSGEVFERFPDYIVGCVWARGIVEIESQYVEELLTNAEIRARARYSDSDLKSELPFASWREAFSRAGWSPSRYPASTEALHKRIQRGDHAPRVNLAVDLANAAALYYSAPVGVHDTSTFNGSPLEVRAATEDDIFVDMSGNTEPGVAGEIVYAVGKDIRTRRWVWRQSKSALVAPGAIDVFYPVDGFAPQTLNFVEAAVNFLAETCRAELGATVSSAIVSTADPEFRL